VPNERQREVKTARSLAEKQKLASLEVSTAPVRANSVAKKGGRTKAVAWAALLANGKRGMTVPSATTNIELSTAYGPAKPNIPYRVISVGFDWVCLAVNGRPLFTPHWAVV